MSRLIRINPRDNVAVALEDLKAGENAGVTLREDIGRGHKFALRPIRNGENIVKYGMPIGTAKADIAEGEKVHTHNIRTRLDGVLNYEYHPDLSHAPHNGHEDFFMGYRRFDGRVGIRNNIWIIPTVGCVNTLAENLAKAANEKLPAGAVERVIALWLFPAWNGSCADAQDSRRFRKAPECRGCSCRRTRLRE